MEQYSAAILEQKLWECGPKALRKAFGKLQYHTMPIKGRLEVGGSRVQGGGVPMVNFLKNAQNGLKHLENEFGVILSTFFFRPKWPPRSTWRPY